MLEQPAPSAAVKGPMEVTTNPSTQFFCSGWNCIKQYATESSGQNLIISYSWQSIQFYRSSNTSGKNATTNQPTAIRE